MLNLLVLQVPERSKEKEKEKEEGKNGINGRKSKIRWIKEKEERGKWREKRGEGSEMSRGGETKRGEQGQRCNVWMKNANTVQIA